MQSKKTLFVSDSVIDTIYLENKIPIINQPDFYPNMYLKLEGISKSALGKVDYNNSCIELIKNRKSVYGMAPKNKEQVFALDALMNEDITVVVLTGASGGGKSFCSLLAALQKMQTNKYEKIVLTKPMQEVGRYKLGSLPGDEKEKIMPYLINYQCNIERILGSTIKLEDLINDMKLSIIPIQLLRGASFYKSFILADEVQILYPNEILTIGTRIGEKSKLVLMGDLNQRDENIDIKDTGLYKLINNDKFLNSPLTAHINFQKCERSPTAALFANIFEGV